MGIPPESIWGGPWFGAYWGCYFLVNSVSQGVNRFSGDFPTWIYSLSSLKYLNLQKNQFTCRLPSARSLPSGLEELLLNSNAFDGQIPADLHVLKNLRNFNIVNNNIEGSIPDIFDAIMPMIAIFDFSRNRITGALPTSLGTSVSRLPLILLSHLRTFPTPTHLHGD
jgi:hypothetical protein